MSREGRSAFDARAERADTGMLVAVGSFCGAVVVAAVASALADGRWTLIAVLAWLFLLAAGCLVYCAARIHRRPG